jgi:hypothetical protein
MIDDTEILGVLPLAVDHLSERRVTLVVAVGVAIIQMIADGMIDIVIGIMDVTNGHKIERLERALARLILICQSGTLQLSI